MQLGPFHFVRVTLWMAFKKSAQIDLWAKRQVEEGGGTCSPSEESALFTPPLPNHHQQGCRKGAWEVFINHTSLFVRLPLLPCLYRRFSLSAEGMHGGYGEAESPTEKCCGVISPMWCSLWDQTQRVSLGAVMVNQPSISYIRRLLFCCFFLHALPFFFFPLSLLQLVEATALPLPPSPTCTVLSLCHKGFRCLPSAVASMTRLYQTLTLDSFFFFLRLHSSGVNSHQHHL